MAHPPKEGSGQVEAAEHRKKAAEGQDEPSFAGTSSGMPSEFEEKQCREVHFRGQVQGVGFRFTTQSIAKRFQVTGFVENLPDGRVRLVAEGEKSELSAFLAAVSDQMAGFIAETHVDRRSASGQYKRFEIRH